MSVPAGQVGGGESGINGFFSNFRNILQGIGGIVDDVAPIFTGNTVNNPPQTNQPTYQGNNQNSPTTGSASTTIESQNTLAAYMPYLLIGGAILIVVVALKK